MISTNTDLITGYLRRLKRAVVDGGVFSENLKEQRKFNPRQINGIGIFA